MSETTPDQKTEEPTPRRLEKALEEGQIAYSSELVGGLVVLAGVFFFFLFGKWFFDSIMNAMKDRLSLFNPMLQNKESILIAMRENVIQVGLACCGLMGVVAVISIVSGALQTNLNITFKPLELNWKKMNPLSGIKRIFSSRSVTRGLVAIGKASSIIVATWILVRSKFDQIIASSALNLEQLIGLACQIILAIGFVTAVLMVVIGMIDYVFQRWKQHEELKMSFQEIRDENKELEGDPMIKARIRRLQNEMGRSKMLSDVPKATVIITNPTHYAVALQYDPEVSDAPIVIAKGTDFLAKKIIAIGKENGVAIVERKPLARFMYANVDVGQPIPFEIYQTVAEVLNFVRRTNSAAA